MKRTLDIAGAGLALVVLAPALAATAAAIRLSMGSPVLFTQIRPGLHGRPFTLYKFRTMTEETRPDGKLRSDGERLTGLGRFLRSTSLDELPELFNVMKGEMSLVGPRPLLVRYLDLYTPEQARRHEVKPGLTGLAQINGRNNLSWNERFRLDVWYVDHRSLLLDLKIILLTFVHVLRREGVSQEGHDTVVYFDGEGG